ncbi:MAG: trypsin-like peptidase domain-containing protein [Paraglaciecola sp.]|uniref:trypsin-like peptidase domain-containing protein n=1 Tax=Paraglaciecola sp. TaxID=1920173 RepID=UPI003297B1CC
MQTNIAPTLFKVFSSLAFLIFTLACSDLSKPNNWNDTVKQTSTGVVSIQMDVPVSFDGKWNSSSYATGFVVDAEQGIILTNRHVVSPGPVTAKAILINNEEIDLTPLYIDPVHDFGFFQYTPSDIKHITPHQFTLSDNEPQIGQEIRIIGNDAGQKISILDGTISRLDRDAPKYGKGNYNDFNTFYIQAATSSTGGSSGSPVINVKGEVIALNAGSQSKSANSFFVPLDKIKLALKKLQNKQTITRGSLQTTFVSTPYAELQRLGLSDEMSTQYRKLNPELKGLLVVRSIVPDSPAYNLLAVGDVLLTMENQAVATFSKLETYLDSHANKNINMSVLRRGEILSFDLQVTDLKDITPSAYLKFDDGIFHDLSYQQARHFNKPISGVYVALSRYLFNQGGVPSRSVITEFNGVKIKNINDLNAQLKVIEDGTKVNLRYFDFSTPNTTNYGLVEINRRWFEHSLCTKNTELGYWPCKTFDAPTDRTPKEVKADPTTVITDNIEDALVMVKFNSPYSIQGRSGISSTTGTGVIVDAKKGWVIAPRSVVLSTLGDVKLVFKNQLEIVAKVEYIHPIHNLALVSFEPNKIHNINLAQITMKPENLQAGDEVLQVGLNYDGIVEYRATTVDSTEELWINQYQVPRFIDTNLKSTYLVNANSFIEGVLVNNKNQVTGLWTSFNEPDENGKKSSSFITGISIDYVLETIALATSKRPVYSLDINLTQISPVDALQMGLSNDWLNTLMSNNPDAQKLLAIYNVAPVSASADIFKRGDILLAINDKPVTEFRQVEKLSQVPNVTVTYFSEGLVKTTPVATTPLYGQDINRVFYWSGAYLHAPHRAAQLQAKVNDQGVYVASYNYGSPATRYGVYAMRRIVEIDGTPITTADDFLEAVKNKQHQETVIIKTLDFNNIPKITTLRMDNNYWPFYELIYQDGDWHRVNHLNTPAHKLN